MAGGIWTEQNKVRPGVYINFASEPQVMGTVGERGIVTFALPLSWGEPKKVLAIQAGEPVKERLGYDLTAPEMLLVREAFKRAKTLLLYRLNTGTKAAAVNGGLTVTAKYGGVRGNDISLVVRQNIDDNTKFDVITLLDGKEVDRQTVADIDGLQNNAWVDFSGTGELTLTAGLPLTGGDDGIVTNEDHTGYLSAVEVHDFHTMALVSADSTLKAVYASFAKRLREEEGRKIQVMVEKYPEANSEGVISVKNGVKLKDGTTLNSVQATVWVAAATAAAQIDESLTYQAYDGAIDVDERYTNKQIEEILRNGEFVFVHNGGRALVEQDINTWTQYTPEKGKAFSKNRVVRVLDGIANDFKRIFESFYLGKVDNNADGRSLFRKECVNYLETLQNRGAIQNFDAQNDVKVLAGADPDSILVEVNIQPVDAVEKIYMKVQVR